MLFTMSIPVSVPVVLGIIIINIYVEYLKFLDEEKEKLDSNQNKNGNLN